MANTELTNYIVASRANGVVDSVIKETLHAQGWQQADISEAFAAVPASAKIATKPMVKQASTIPFLVALVLLLAAVGGGFWYWKKHPSTSTTVATQPAFSENTYATLGTNEKFIQGTVTLADVTCKNPRVFTETDNSYDPATKTSRGRAIDATGHFKTVGLADAPTEVEVWDGTLDHTHGTLCLSALYDPTSTTPLVVNADSTALALISGNLTSDMSPAKVQTLASYTTYSSWLKDELKTHPLTAIETDTTLDTQLTQLSSAVTTDAATNAVAVAQ